MYRIRYVPVYTPPEERDFFSYLDELKYEETIKNTDKYFKEEKVINFYLIHHMCRGDPVEKDARKHISIQNTDFNKYPKPDKKKVVDGALRNPNKIQQQIFIKRETVLDYFLNK